MKTFFDFNTRRCCYSPLLLLAVAIPLAGGSAHAIDLSTTNVAALPHFWSAIESSNRPVTVVSFGDSMADSYRSVAYHTINKLRTKFGTAGYSLNNYGNTALYQLTNGAFVLQGGPLWYSYYFGIPPAAALWWNNQPTPGGTYCNSAGIFYVSQTNGGQFRLSVSTNGGPWTTKLELDGYSANPTGHFTNLMLAPNSYRLRVDSDTGTNYIIGSSTVLTTSSGIHSVFMDQPGVPLYSVTNIPIAIRDPIFAGLKADLLIWHMKEPIPPLDSGMRECEQWWSNAAPNCDIIYIGTPWLSEDTNSTVTIDQNTIVRQIAIDYHHTYADLMQPTVSYEWLLTNGYMADATHLNSAGSLYCANIMWDDLGFYALGLNRRLKLQPTGAQLQLSYNTSTGATYRLESSPNLKDWSVLLTNQPITATFTTNFIPPPGPIYYRLGLAPP